MTAITRKKERNNIPQSTVTKYGKKTIFEYVETIRFKYPVKTKKEDSFKEGDLESIWFTTNNKSTFESVIPSGATMIQEELYAITISDVKCYIYLLNDTNEHIDGLYAYKTFHTDFPNTQGCDTI